MSSQKSLTNPLPPPAERHTDPPTRWLLFRKRATALLIDAVLVGVLSAALTVLLFWVTFKSHPDLESPAQLVSSAFFLGLADCVAGTALLFAFVGLVCWLWPYGPVGLAAIFFGHLFTSPFGFSSLSPPSISFTIFGALFSNCFYHVVFESSRLSATPGKLILGLQVVSRSGDRPGSFRLLFRHAVKFLSALSACLPLSCLLICNRWQLLHDRLTATAVDLKRSPTVAAALQKVSPNQAPEAVTVVGLPASIPRRILASVLDGILFYATESLLIAAAVALIIDTFPLPTLATVSLMLAGVLIALFATILVLAAFESSILKATPGKIVAGIQIIDKNGQRITLFQALTKQFIQGLIYIAIMQTSTVLWIFGLAGWVCLKLGVQCLVGLWVIAFFGFYLGYGVLLCVTFTNGQTIVDKLSDRWVIREPERKTLSKELSSTQRRAT